MCMYVGGNAAGDLYDMYIHTCIHVYLQKCICVYVYVYIRVMECHRRPVCYIYKHVYTCIST